MELRIKSWELIIIILLSVFIGLATYHELASRTPTINTITQEQFRTEFEKHPNSNGYTVYGKYFVVITANRSMDDITRTTMHELAHVFDYSDPEHFCARWTE